MMKTMMEQSQMTLPETMTAISIEGGGGGPEVLQPESRPMPRPGQGELLVRVEAAGVNRPDVLQRKGNYPPPPGASDIPGLEIAGEVVEAGPGVSRFKLGDRIAALTTGGGYAEYCLADERAALPFPQGFDAVQAASLPETFFTVWQNVFLRGGLKSGERFLVHGGSSGIGVTAIQLAKAFGATVYATAGSAEKCEAVRKLGADRAINYREEDFVAVLKAETGGKGVNLILDMVGGDYVERNILAVAEDGRIHQIAFQTGSKVTVDLMRLMLKRVTLTGSTLRPRPMEVKGQIAKGLEEQVWPLLAKGEVKPVIDSTFPLEQASEAHRRMETNAHIGKIILTI
jgi:putative PIG3 family NAD(P)H quinone oxidoreductase